MAPSTISFFLIFIVYFLYNVVLVSTEQQSESAIRIYIYPLFSGFLSHLCHHRAMSRVPSAIQ